MAWWYWSHSTPVCRAAAPKPVTKYRIRNFFVPRARSTTMPNITRVYMLKKMCHQPPCMNMCVSGCHQRKKGDAG